LACANGFQIAKIACEAIALGLTLRDAPQVILEDIDMAGMLQILTYLLAFYLVIKGIEVLQIGLASSRERRGAVLTLGWLTLLACAIAAFGFTTMQDNQASFMNSNTSTFGR
jgi:hypothetical protein